MFNFISRPVTFSCSVALAAAATIGLSGCSDSPQEPAAEAAITIYTARKEHLVKPLFDRYTAETGVPIRYVTDKAGPLLQRLQSEGSNTPADMLITVDAGNLWQAGQQGVLKPLQSEVLDASVPVHLRAADNTWFGLSVRARTIVYATDRVKPEQLSSYEDLADPKWKGRLCLRTSKKVYNQSLVATMINTLGEAETENIVKGWVANLATAPYSNDTKTMEAVAAGQCDVAIVNTYYFGRLKNAQPDIALALFWPNQSDRGVHINVSGAGITKHAKHPEQALALLEWLAGSEAQGQFAEVNQEYPVNAKVQASAEVQAWGEFKADAVNVEAAGRLQEAAVKLMDRAGYN